MAISPRILRKSAVHVQTQQDSWGDGRQAPGLGKDTDAQIKYGFLIKPNSKEIDGLLKTKQQPGNYSQESLCPQPWANQKIQQEVFII